MDYGVNKILAIVLTYYPDRELLTANTNKFLDYVDKVLLWENTPEQEKLHYRFLSGDKFEYCGDGINSISHALNYAWRYAKDFGFDYLLIMDQDSLWCDFNSYLNETIFNEEAPDGIWGPQITDENKQEKVLEVYSVINSGTLVRVDLIDAIGGWNELFKIDCVDDEFCLRAKRLGISTYRFTNCRLLQRYGSPRQVSFMGKKSNLRNDSPQRLYSIYRSFIVLLRMYPEAVQLRRQFMDNWIALIKWIFVFEKDRFSKLFAITRGIVSGYTYKIKKT